MQVTVSNRQLEASCERVGTGVAVPWPFPGVKVMEFKVQDWHGLVVVAVVVVVVVVGVVVVMVVVA